MESRAHCLEDRLIFGIDCDRPQDPEIAFKLIAVEPIVAVASPSFIKLHKKRGSQEMQDWPHLFCERLNPDRILDRLESRISIVARFNDIAATRSACVHGAGWAFLPYYAVRKEIQNRELVLISDEIFWKSKYGVWWLRGRPQMKELCEAAGQWISTQTLGPL